MARQKKKQKQKNKKTNKNIIFLCPDCKKKLKLKSFNDGYKACYYCGIILLKPPFSTADNTIIPDIIKIVKHNKKNNVKKK